MSQGSAAVGKPYESMLSGLILLGLSRETIDEALATTDRTKRQQGKCPDHVLVQFVVMMGLFMDLSYDHILEILHEALASSNLAFENLGDLTNSAITQARQRVGPQALKSLFEKTAKPLCSKESPYAFLKDLRIVIIDGSVFQIQDSEENRNRFGKSANQNGASGLPLINTVTLIEHGSRAPLDFTFGPYRKGLGKEPASEQGLCKEILARLPEDALCIGDRLYANHDNCKLVNEAKSHFLFRVRNDVKLTPVHEYPDGSYDARLYYYINRKRQKTFITVRVIEYRLNGETKWHRLVTNLGFHEASVSDLVRLYPLRWTEETVFNEIKATLKPSRLALRSKSPAMVEQELYGLFIAYYLMRRLMLQAAIDRNLVPEQLSFSHALFVTRQAAPKIGAFSPRRTLP